MLKSAMVATAAMVALVIGVQSPALAVYETRYLSTWADGEIMSASAEITYYSSGPNFKWTVCHYAGWVGDYAILRVKDNTTGAWLGRANDLAGGECKSIWAPGKVAGHSYTAELWTDNDPMSQPHQWTSSTTFTAPY